MKRVAIWAMVAAGLAGGTGVARGDVGDVFNVDGLNYKVLSEDEGGGTVEVGQNNDASGDVAIPASVQNGGSEYRVTGIGAYAFAASGVTSVTMPEGLERIGDSAFYGSFSLSTTRIPVSVTSIGEAIFGECVALGNFGVASFWEGKVEWWRGTPEYYPAQQVTFEPNGGMCEVAWKGVERGDGKTYGDLPEAGQQGCTFQGWYTASTGGVPVTAESGVTDDSERTLWAHWWEEGSETVGETTWFYWRGAEGTGVTISGVAPASGALSIPETLGGLPVTAIGNWAFENDEFITALEIPAGVTNIGKEAFKNCGQLAAMAIPDGVKDIGDWAFCGCSTLTNLTLGAGVESIGKQSFMGCFSLTAVEIPAGVRSIGDGAFQDCSVLTDTRIPPGVAEIGANVFEGCDALTFEAPDYWEGKVEWGGGNPVYYKTQTVTFDANGGECGTAEKRVECGEGKTYGELPEATREWHTFAGWFTEAEGGDGVTAGSAVTDDSERTLWAHWTDGASEDANGATWTYKLDEEGTGVTIVRVKGTDFFQDIPGTLGGLPVTGIGDKAFEASGMMQEVSIPASVLRVADNVFEDAMMLLGTVHAPRFLEGKTEWGGAIISFYYPAQLVTFDAAEGTCAPSQKGVECGHPYGALPVPEWGDNIFLGWFDSAVGGEEVKEDSEATSDRERTLWAHWMRVETVGGVKWFFTPDGNGTGATVMGADPAEGALAIPGTLGGLTVTGIGEEAFKGCGALTGAAIPDSVESIGKGAFEGSGLTDARIPVGVLDIGEGVFAGCEALTTFEAASFWEGKVDWGNGNAAYYPAQLVTFDANGGTCATARMGVERVEGATYGSLPAATRDGWRFAGWFTEATGGERVTAKSGVSEENERTLYAQWELVTGVKARQRWPWNGLVDIDYEILEGMDTTGLEVEITVAAGGTNWVAQTFLAGAEPSSAAGKHRATWDAAADVAGEIVASNLVATVALVQFAPETLYGVIDLSKGTQAASYPFSYLAEVPEGGWGDDCKTTKLVMRRVTRGDWNNGAFQMGGATETAVAKAYYIGVFPVTQKQWQQVTGEKPSYFAKRDCYAARPVEQVSYSAIRGASAGAGWPGDNAVDGTSFLGLLRAKTGIGALDLPTEAQWEFACRAGTTNDFNSGSDCTNNTQDAVMDAVGRYACNGGMNDSESCGTDGGTAAVGSYAANAWGLYDMHGNVWEWCLDWWDDSPAGGIEPKGPESGTMRVLRGGAWNEFAGRCTSSARTRNVPSGSSYGGGFRLAWTPAPGEVPTTNVTSGKSAAFRLDTRSGVRESTGDETLAYSALWAGEDGATVTIAEDGAAFAEGLEKEGEQAWSAAYNGTYTLTHATVAGGVTGAVETAQFTVSGKAERPQTVTFDANGGTCETKTKEYVRGGKYGELPTATWKDHEWLGWWTAKEGGRQVTTNSTVTTNLTRTLHAQWREVTEQDLYEAWLDGLGLADEAGVAYKNRNKDFDKDGVSNWNEYLADTNPGDSNDSFQVTATLDGAGNVLLTSDEFSTARRYSLLTYTNLNAAAAEKDLGKGKAGMVVTNKAEKTEFWRVKVGVE